MPDCDIRAWASADNITKRVSECVLIAAHLNVTYNHSGGDSVTLDTVISTTLWDPRTQQYLSGDILPLKRYNEQTKRHASTQRKPELETDFNTRG